jgi:phage terminase small subunit
MNKKPPELHLIDGTKPRGKSTQNVATIPEKLKQRIPEAEWLESPDAWDRKKFIAETSEFLSEMYGIGTNQDKHSLGMLADQIETYIDCMKGLKETGLVMDFNDGKTVGMSPYVSIKNKAATLIIQLMNELGLTPRGRLSSSKSTESESAAKFLRGPKG